MTLNEANAYIEAFYPDYIEVKEKYNDFMREYAKRKSEITLMDETMGCKNAEIRDAHITLTLETEGLNDKKQEISNNYYRIKLKMDFLQEITSNLRALTYREKE